MPNPKPKSDLLDINVWLALANEHHAHHKRARQYWETEAADQLAFTRVTMLGFVRLLTNRAAMQGQPFTPSDAWAVYHSFRQLPEVIWLGELERDADDVEKLLAGWLKAKDFSTLHWTDSYLAALASQHGCRLVSFDAGYRRYKPLTFLHLVA